MYTSDIKIFELILILKQLRMIRFKSEFLNTIGVLKQNEYRIKQGLAHFTHEHIEIICKIFNVNANWIYGIEENVFRTSQTSTNTRGLRVSMPATLKCNYKNGKNTII